MHRSRAAGRGLQPRPGLRAQAGRAVRGEVAVDRAAFLGHARERELEVLGRDGEGHPHGRLGRGELVFVFLAVFALYFFSNWKILAFLWRIG